MEAEVQGLSFKKIFWIFVIGSMIGAFYEEGLYIVRNLIHFGVFDWQPRRGVFWGPFSPVYGIGAVVMCLILVNNKDSIVKTFIKASLLGGGVEYIISFLQEFFLGTKSWNYSNYFLNINGRTTVPYMLFWGLLGILFVKFIYPFLSSKIDSLTVSFGDKFTIVLIILLSLDMLISWTALIRQTLRHYDVPSFSVVGKFYDKHFDDDYILKKFPNMVRSD